MGNIEWWSPTFFPAKSLGQFSLVANLGLILFMFFVGMEVDVGQMRGTLKAAAPIAVSAIVVPFLIGLAASFWLYIENGDPNVNRVGFVLFFSSSMSFTAFPGNFIMSEHNERNPTAPSMCVFPFPPLPLFIYLTFFLSRDMRE